MAHFSIDLREEFRAGVVDGWLEDHAAGLTPNPCVRCNGNVRLDAMLDLADRLGAHTLATGHYARVWHAKETGVPHSRIVTCGERVGTETVCQVQHRVEAHVAVAAHARVRCEPRRVVFEPAVHHAGAELLAQVDRE